MLRTDKLDLSRGICLKGVMNQMFHKRAKRSYQEFIERLRFLEVAHPNLLTTIVIGKSDGREIPKVMITDATVPAIDKQCVLLTAMHTGCEYSGANVLFDLIDYLVSDDESARSIRATQEIHIVPIVNVFAYESRVEELMQNQYRNAFGHDPYQGEHWTFTGVTNVEENPEAHAIQRVIDHLQPELMIDCHGVFYADQLMTDQTGLSVSGLGRAHNKEFVRRMAQEAENHGHAMDYEDDRQRILPVANESTSLYAHRYQTCSPRVTPNSYAHHRYHSLAFTIEISEEGSGLWRLRKALEMGNEIWALDNLPGYPVGKVWGEGLYDICAQGSTPKALRDSRVELWQRLEHMSIITFGPQMPGRFTFVVSWDRKLAADLDRLQQRRPGEVMALLAKHGAIQSDIADYYAADPLFTCPGFKVGLGNDEHALRHGVSFRFKIPYARAKIRHVVLNDQVLPLSSEPGYETYVSRNFTIVKINLPAESSDQTFYLLDVLYEVS